ncbi:MAG: hypothetical protein WC227_01975 [Patescibacteria group bacterium]|jgi:hypothetical protein
MEFENEDEKFLVEELVNLFDTLPERMNEELAKGGNDWLAAYGSVLQSVSGFAESPDGKKFLPNKYCLPGKYEEAMGDLQALKDEYKSLAPGVKDRPDISDEKKEELVKSLQQIGTKLGLPSDLENSPKL